MILSPIQIRIKRHTGQCHVALKYIDLNLIVYKMTYTISLLKFLNVIVILSLIYETTWGQQPGSLEREIHKMIIYDTDISFKKTPGFIIGIIKDTINEIVTFGQADKKNKKSKLTTYDIFEIGSITKPFISELTYILHIQGVVDIHAPINSYLPSDFQNPRMENITLYDLLVHRSGLPKLPHYFGKKNFDVAHPFRYYSKNDLLKFYTDFIPTDSTFIYSHTNYALIECILESASGRTLEDLAYQYMWIPLNLQNTFFDFPEQKDSLLTPGYNRHNKATEPWIFSSFKGAEGLKSSMQDLLIWLQLHIRPTKGDIGEAIRFGLEPINIHTFNEKLIMSPAWHIVPTSSGNIYTYSGHTSGHHAIIAYNIIQKTGVIILSNSSIGTEDLAFQILKMIQQ